MKDKRLTIQYENKPCYDIVFYNDFQSLPNELATLNTAEKKICIVTDSKVESFYGNEVCSLLSGICKKACIYAFPEGEESKNLNTVKDLYAFLIENHFDRKDLLVALGGGVVGDLTGFAAATYLRGIDFVQIPTTLLAQADSSIGGKTGVDFDSYKNMVGAFHMPKLVYMNVATLTTLDERQFFAGFAEIMKHGLIKDEAFYLWLIDHMYEICDRDLTVLSEMTYRSCGIKKAVVENDPLEKGERALLNFGHTLGHAIEKAKHFSLLHGECVALGAVAAAFISWKRDMISMEEYYEIRDMFVPFNLPISIDNIDPKEVLLLTKSDKKMEAGHLKFVLLKGIGHAVIDTTVTEQEILDAVNEIYFSEEDAHE